MCTIYTWFGMVLQIENILKGEVWLTVSSTMPIWLNIAYSIGCSERKRKYNYSKMAAILKYKRTSITTIWYKFRLVATFHNRIHSHWSLPLSKATEMPFQFFHEESSGGCLLRNIKYCQNQMAQWHPRNHHCFGICINYQVPDNNTVLTV